MCLADEFRVFNVCPFLPQPVAEVTRAALLGHGEQVPLICYAHFRFAEFMRSSCHHEQKTLYYRYITLASIDENDVGFLFRSCAPVAAVWVEE